MSFTLFLPHPPILPPLPALQVDAALDATNVARVAHYIRDRTRAAADNGFQSIVISLKVRGGGGGQAEGGW